MGVRRFPLPSIPSLSKTPHPWDGAVFMGVQLFWSWMGTGDRARERVSLSLDGQRQPSACPQQVLSERSESSHPSRDQGA